MELDHTELLRTFIAESEENLSAMEEGLLQLEAHPDDAAHLDQVFRAAHTLKGNSSSLGFKALAELAHDAEAILDRVRGAELRPDGHLISLLLSAVDAMKRWLPSLQMDREIVIDDEQLETGERLRRFALGAPPLGAAADDSAAQRLDIAAHAEARPAARTIRLDAARMDALLDLAGEITIAADRTRRRLDALPAEMRSTLIDLVEEQDRLLRDLHQTVMKCRMVPIGPTFRRHVRTVRDLERSTGRPIRLTMEGEEVEMDMTVVEALADPLVHLIRNAIDHGIEPSDVRLKRGKDPAGSVKLTAQHERDTIVVKVIDDGTGIRLDKVRQRAMAMGLEALAMPDAELVDLIFTAGFSTAETVTPTSGRGVGMDVVRRNIERVRGRIQVDSRPGEGTTVIIRLPLTLAVIAGFVVGVGGELFVLPLSVVTECLEHSASGDAPSGVMYVRGEAVPFVALRSFLGFGGERRGQEVVILVEHEGGRAGLVVDEVLGETQTVVKAAGPVLLAVTGVTGTAVMGNGSVAMVIDPAAIFREVKRKTGRD
jgi:two-component system chemotaxis sensor kinase CheA